MFVVNVDWFFMSHRLPIAIEAMRQGYEVHVAAGVTDRLDALIEMGLLVHPLSIERSNTGLLNVLKTFWQLVCLFRRERPDVVHLVTIKPVLLGGIAARLTGVKSVVAAVSGLGFVFLDAGIIADLRKVFVTLLYRVALGQRNLKVIFQNPEDRDCLMQLTGLISTKTEMIRGSGVDLSKYKCDPLPDGIPVIMMAARLLRDKGVYEFVEAARILRKRGCLARFCLVGMVDPDNRSSVSGAELSGWSASGVIEHWGYRSDMHTILSSAYLVVLPSYREGLPKILIEAAACGRAVITTDVPGCRDAIEPGVTGILVPPRDSDCLADAMLSLIEDRQRCQIMGEAGRALAISSFDINYVVTQHLQIYQQLLRASV